MNNTRNNTIKAVNLKLSSLYWNIGAYINQKVEKSVNRVYKRDIQFTIKTEPEIKDSLDKSL